ncbi:MAG TPA: phage tail tape measure protein [Methanolinea sp.]|nr:phage tail tape measure protein [Methanolinea sp.]HQJ88444.1 phage tail tape measure protein [Methanoregulaceae archaeon]
MTVVDELTIAFKADIADLKAGMSQIKSELGQVQQSAKALTFIEAGEALKGMGQGLTQNVTTPILGFFQDSIRASSDAAEEASKFKEVFKELSGSGESWVSTTATEMGRAESTVRSFAASFGAVLSPQFEGNRQAALELSEGYTQLAIDLASFYNVSEEEAKTSLMSAIAGETEPMRRFGVMLNEAAINAELMAMGLNKTQKEASAAELQQARYNVVMKATKDAQGDAVRTSDGFANSMRALQGAFEQVKIEIGDVLMPVVLQVVGVVKQAIAWFKELNPGIKRIAVVFGILAAAVGPVLVVFGTLLSAVGSIVAVLGTGGLAGALAALTGPVGLVVLAVTGLVAGFAAMYASSEKFRGMISGIITGVVDMGKAFIEWITPIKDTIVAAVMPALKNFGDFLGEQFKKITAWVRGEGKSFIDFLGAIAEGLQTTIVNGIKVLGGVYRDYLEPVLKWLISTALDFILDELKRLGDWFKSPATQQGIKDVSKALEALWGWLEDVGGIIKDTVIPALDGFFDFFDPAHTEDITGMTMVLKILWEAYDVIARVLRGDLAGAYEAAKTFQADFTAAIRDGVIPAVGDAKRVTGDLAGTTNDLKTAAANARDPLASLKSLFDGIAGSAGTANTTAGKLLTTLKEIQAQPAVPTVGPVALGPTSPTGKAPAILTPQINPPARTPTTAAEIAAEARRRAEEEAKRKAGEGPVNGHGITVVRQWVQDGYWWTQFSDGTTKKGAAVTTQPSAGNRRAFGESGITLVINNPVGESASKSLEAARRLARRLGSTGAVI